MNDDVGELFRIPGLEWSDVVLLCNASSRLLESAVQLRQLRLAAPADSSEIDAALTTLDCRTAGRRRRLGRALVRPRDEGSGVNDIVDVLSTKEPVHSSEIALVCTHHKEDYHWAVELLSERADILIIIYDCGIHSVPLPETLVKHPRVHIRSKIGPLAKAPFFYSCFDFSVCEYECLPRRLVLFLHGHDTAWHQKLCIRELISLGKAAMMEDPSLQYVSCNDRVHRDWVEPNRKMLGDVTTHWATVSNLLGESSAPPRCIYEVHAAQAIIRCDRILQRPRAVWDALRAHAASLQFHEPEDLALEGMFHYILGEPWSRPFVQQHLKQLATGSANELEIRNSIRLPKAAPPTPWDNENANWWNSHTCVGNFDS
mmetsp:Transcript_29509/g.48918  ORF Transcript_29509/g.48918 Transcript_29509/m.48918 type:complete len:372 (-) Transcript_29509:225-1340(-)|eukprot:CAMPEP_0119300924 /NCGR_PEP_ID=MMETSP1333-20130426/2807_1 /TAXON_ID=418940 /ORGANISM="Scyphosphaera apsteinii, Strain RCC1455" /LENGTH=371 /DNA_ID=CAMNT_0007302859 /DNA_START=304 /DNA_END=1419 /DNA_ORIENTATION=-